MNGNAAMIRKLLDAGVDPNSANPGGETALMTAAQVGKVDAVKLLLDRGANDQREDTEHGQTALMWAVGRNHVDMLELLLARGADINAHTNAITKGEYVLSTCGSRFWRRDASASAPCPRPMAEWHAAFCDSRWQCTDDAAAVLGSRRRDRRVVRQSYDATHHCAAERASRARHRAA